MYILLLLASYADVLRLVTRSSPRTLDEPKNVCVGGYVVTSIISIFPT